MIELMMMSIYILLSILIITIIFFLSKPSYLSTLFYIILLSIYITIVLFSSVKKGYDEEIFDMKDKFKKYKKKIDELYAEQLKSMWTNAMNERNKYFILCSLFFTFFPFFYFLFYLLTQPIGVSLDEIIKKYSFPIAVVSGLFFMSITLFTFIFIKQLNYFYFVAPLVLSVFLVFFSKTIHFVQTNPMLSIGLLLMSLFLSICVFAYETINMFIIVLPLAFTALFVPMILQN
jgi:hypothetical protein